VLEHPLAAQAPRSSLEPVVASEPNASSVVAQVAEFWRIGQGHARIGGAYVLRAVEESSSLPRMVVASAGIAYAFMWLALAARRRTQMLSSTIYACTSALILPPCFGSSPYVLKFCRQQWPPACCAPLPLRLSR